MSYTFNLRSQGEKQTHWIRQWKMINNTKKLINRNHRCKWEYFKKFILKRVIKMANFVRFIKKKLKVTNKQY